MGLTANRGIVSEQEVAEICFEADLGNLSAGGATIDGTIRQATNALRRWAKTRGIDPDRVVNVDDFKAAAAYWVCATVFAAQPQGDEENARKAVRYAERFAEELRTLIVETDAQPDAKSLGARGLPRVVNLDAEPSLTRPRDNRRPGRGPGPYFGGV